METTHVISSCGVAYTTRAYVVKGGVLIYTDMIFGFRALANIDTTGEGY